MKRQLSFDEFQDHCFSIADEIQRDFGNNVVIAAVARGGLTAAHWIAKRLGVDVAVVTPDKDSVMKVVGSATTNIVFVDDITSSGGTRDKIMTIAACALTGSLLKELKESSIPEKIVPKVRVRYASVVVDIAKCQSIHKINYVGLRTSDWIVMPYEEFDRVIEGDNGLFRDRTNRYATVQTGVQKFGFDIDGVLFPDMTRECVCDPEMVEHSVVARDLHKPLFSLPKGSVLITGRPQSDAEQTHRWAQEWFDDPQVHVLGAAEPLTLEESTAEKAVLCMRLGVTVFIESDKNIAAGMNRLFDMNAYKGTALSMNELLARACNFKL